MRHRCSPWMHIPCQRQGCEGWKVVKESIELQDRPQCSSRLSWQIIICSVLTPQEFMNNHPKMAHPPEACCYSGRPTLYSFASVLNACFKKKILQVQHIKTSMTRSHNIQISAHLCSSSLALIILFRLGFQTYANELGIWKGKRRGRTFSASVNELIFGFAINRKCWIS